MRRAPEPGLPVVVSGMVGAVPGHGGATWAVLQYVHGLRGLGYEPVLLEAVASRDFTPAARAYFSRVCERAGLSGRSALIDDSGRTSGMDRADLVDLIERAPALLNLAGTLRDPDLLGRIPTRVYVDLDPAFTQLWQSLEGLDMGLAGHTHYASVGLDIGRPTCDIPTLDREWIPTLPPVCLQQWPVSKTHPGDAWTTVANWRGYGSISDGERRYGQKAHAFRPLFELPGRTSARFALALAIHPDEASDLAALETNRWIVLDPENVSSTPDRYRRFVSESYAELGVAKEGYVEADCGWFSDRSACYLAAGKPVLALDTGFGRHLPTGEGLIAFRDIDEAVAGVEAIQANYAAHARAARDVAEAHLDARVVVGRLLERVGVA
ncbi:MAG: hypothetical protein OEU54_01995 [Gemmatimonadota bacterium]|nr:hypothetical protein [Gemmatimonadota bacterium]